MSENPGPLPLQTHEDDSLVTVLERLAYHGWVYVRLHKAKDDTRYRALYKDDVGIASNRSWTFWNWLREKQLIVGPPPTEWSEVSAMRYAEEQFAEWLAAGKPQRKEPAE